MPPNECPTNVYGPRMPDLLSSARRSLAISGRVRGISTAVLRVVSLDGFVYRIVPGRSYLHTRVKRATPEKTAGDDNTGGSACVSVQALPTGRDRAWRPANPTSSLGRLGFVCEKSWSWY
jgi:hypothetical protein